MAPSHFFYSSGRPKLSGRVFLVTYRPLRATDMGRNAVALHDWGKQRGYVDHSCRREPDFLHPNPLISGLCRKEKFAPKLQLGDLVVYLAYENQQYRLAAILHVIRPVLTHQEAEELYQNADQALPSNCMVKSNPPLALDMTGGKTGEVQKMKGLLQHGSDNDKQRAIRQWDGYYWSIVKGEKKASGRISAGVEAAVVTEPLFLSLTDPPLFTAAQLIAAFGPGQGGGVPGTQNPSGKHTPAQLTALLAAAGLPNVNQLYESANLQQSEG